MNDNNNKKKKVSIQHSAEIRVLYQHAGIRGQKLYAMFPQYSKSSICVHMKKEIGAEPVFDRRTNNKGRPRKLDEKDDRRVSRSVKRLRVSDGNFASPRIQVVSGTEHVHNRTMRRSLNRQGYGHRTTRKKGVLLASDLPKRMRWCRKVKRLGLGIEFWRKGVSFYLDGVGFPYKSNPHDQAKAPSAKAWMKSDERLSQGCTAKGRKEGVRNANFMVAVAYDSGTVICKQYFGSITGEKFKAVVESEFRQAFAKCKKPCARRILMDNCTRQNAKVVVPALAAAKTVRFRIPARSPDLNPIENVFHLMNKALKKEAIENKITKESFEDFSQRCVKMTENFPVEIINKTIDSMHKRVNLMLKSKGQRIKY